jgi:hypothetical protein
MSRKRLWTRIQRLGLEAPTEVFASSLSRSMAAGRPRLIYQRDLTMPRVLGKDVDAAAPEFDDDPALPTWLRLPATLEEQCLP